MRVADTHPKPNPPRDWGTLLTELAIVVVGVGLALAAQQAADWLRWEGQVKTARAALRAEMASIADFYLQRTTLASCLDKRLDDTAAMIAQVSAGQVPDATGVAFNGMGRLLSDAEWQSERASQTLTHFPRAELALMGRFYAQVIDMREWVYEETTAWSRMAVLLDAAQKLGPEDLAQLRLNLHMARRYHYTVTVNAQRQLELAAPMGIKPAPVTQAQRDIGCKPAFGRKF